MSQPGNTDYQRRKESGLCVYPGCAVDAGDECVLCDLHRDEQRERQKRSIARIRRQRKRKKQCIYCGKPRRPKRKTCHACAVVGNFLKTSDIDNRVDKKQRRLARTAVDKDGRTRYRGQPRRGRRTVVNEVGDGMAECQKYLTMAVDGIAYAKSAEVESLPRIQRDEVRLAALGHLHLAYRLARDTLKVGGYPLEKDVDEDEGGEEIDEPVVASGR